MLALHVDEDLSLSEIAESEGISRQGVHDALKRAQTQLMEMEARLGLVRRTRAVQKGLAELSESILKAQMPEAEKQALLQQVETLKSHWEDEHGVLKDYPENCNPYLKN